MTTSTPSAETSSVAVDSSDKTVAILSYLTVIGFVAAVVIHGSKKNQLGTFHLRQSLGLVVTSVALIFGGMVLAFIPFVGWMISFAAWLGLFLLWFLGFLAAANGKTKPVAVLGEQYQKWFSGAFA